MRLRLLIPALLCALAATAADYNAVERRAGRFFDEGEWRSAQALYELMLAERPDSLDTYAHAIVASAMAADNDRVTDLLERSSHQRVNIYGLFDRVRSIAFEIGHASVYGDFLTLTAKQMPWLSRPVDAALLDYYLLRDDGPMIVQYASRMHRGLPSDTRYLANMAYGYMLCGDFDNAVEQWRQILELDPANVDALLYLGNYMADSGRDAEARGYLSRAYQLQPTPYIAHRLSALPL